MPEDFQRRLPSVERQVAGIRPEDIRVSVIGTVIDRDAEGRAFVMDDGTGKVAVALEAPAELKLHQLVRVFGRVIPLEQGVELQGEIVQDMSRLDPDLLKAVRDLKT